MFCPSCGTVVKAGQRFCTSCGIALVDTAVHQSTEALPTVAPAPAPTPAAGPIGEQATAPLALQGAPLPPPSVPAAVSADAATLAFTPLTADAQHQDTTALTVVEQTSYATTPDVWAAHATETMAAQPLSGTESLPLVAAPEGTQPFRITPLAAVGALAGVLAVASAFVAVASYDITGDLVQSQEFLLNDLSSNYTVGAILAALLLVGGAALGATGRRVGTGLAGGAGLALAGMMGMMLGQVTQRFDAQEVSLLQGGGTFTLTTTQDVGYWLAAIAAVLGLVAFALSVSGSGNDGHPPTNAAIGVVGAVATLLVVVGTLIPGELATFSDQFANDLTPPITLLLRLGVLVLIAAGGITGFVSGRRWGLGLALGSISVGVWQWITALTEAGDFPLGIAGGNYGATDFAPHVITSVGVVCMVLAAAAGLLVKPRPQ